tara:strand:- start:641 stop:1264 length:624 start_codon:yes stop_codon:yes gene_type:complete
MPKPKVMPPSDDDKFIRPGTVGKSLRIEDYINMRFGYCDESAESDFIDNINGRFNIYLSNCSDCDGKKYLAIYSCINDHLNVIENGSFKDNVDYLAEEMEEVLEKDVIRNLMLAMFNGNFISLSEHISANDLGSCFEASEAEDVKKYKPCFFGLSSTSYGIENCEIDSEIGTILYLDNEIQNLSEFYGYVDEDKWGQVMCVRLNDHE